LNKATCYRKLADEVAKRAECVANGASDGITARSLIATWLLRVPNSCLRNKKPLVGGLSPPLHQSRAFSASLPDQPLQREAFMRQNQMMSNGRAFGLTMGDWFTLLAGCFAVIALAALLV
jgi:hypothetical protein